ncbi:hypothetical protein U2F10_29320 [Leptothoe sp. EHU-05/26/07-4]
MVTVAPIHQAAWEAYLRQQLDHAWGIIGTVTAANTPLVIQTSDDQPLINLDVATMADSWRYAIERALDV